MISPKIALVVLAWLAAGMAGLIGAEIDYKWRARWGLCFALAMALVVNALMICAWPAP